MLQIKISVTTKLFEMLEKIFLHAVVLAKLEEVEYLLSLGIVNINAVNDLGFNDTALHIAIRVYAKIYWSVAEKMSLLQIIRLLLKAGANIGKLNSKGQTPLSQAICYGDMELILLVTNAPNYDECYSPGLAFQRKVQYVIEFLLRNKWDYKLLLYFIAKFGNAKSFAMCLQTKGKFNINSILPDTNDTIIHFVIFHGSCQMIRDLVKFGVDLEKRNGLGYTPLHHALMFRLTDMALCLLNCGASVLWTNAEGETALHIAARLCLGEQILETILSTGIDVNFKTQVDGRTPLFSCFNSLIGYKTQTIGFFLQNGADFKTTDNKGETLLHVCLKDHSTDYELLEYLLELKADVNIKNKDGDTPLSPLRKVKGLNNKQIWILVKYLVLRIAAKSHVCAENLEMIEQNKVASSFYNSCEMEIGEIKGKICIQSNISYLDFLTKNVQQTSAFVNNQNIMKVLNARLYEKKFPIYRHLLKKRINEAEFRARSEQEALEIFATNFKFTLPLIVQRKILSHLCEIEIIKFVKAFG